MDIKKLMEKTNTSERALREMVVQRLLINDYESQGLFQSYLDNQEEGYKGSFDEFLEEFYRDLGTHYDDIFEEIELKVLENIYNNHYFLD